MRVVLVCSIRFCVGFSLKLSIGRKASKKKGPLLALRRRSRRVLFIHLFFFSSFLSGFLHSFTALLSQKTGVKVAVGVRKRKKKEREEDCEDC